MAKATKGIPVDPKINPVRQEVLTVTIVGKSGLIQHQWTEKARQMLRDKHAGKKTKTREVRNPKQEAYDAAYRTVNGEYGIPVKALKAAIIGAAHKDLGVEKTLVRKALFIPCTDANDVLPMVCDEPIMREDYVRVGQGTDLRYRPEFHKWQVTFDIEFDADLLGVDDISNLIERAGFGVGLCEWRPEKGGENGRFSLANTPA